MKFGFKRNTKFMEKIADRLENGYYDVDSYLDILEKCCDEFEVGAEGLYEELRKEKYLRDLAIKKNFSD